MAHPWGKSESWAVQIDLYQYPLTGPPTTVTVESQGSPKQQRSKRCTWHQLHRVLWQGLLSVPGFCHARHPHDPVKLATDAEAGKWVAGSWDGCPCAIVDPILRCFSLRDMFFSWTEDQF